MSVKLDRINNMMMEEINVILQRDIDDKSISFVTVTSVKVSSDLSYAKVYFLCLDDKLKDEMKEKLNKAKGFIRSELCKKVDIRKMPELNFVYDESVGYGDKIEHIIDEIKKEDKDV